jgi:hypothetical protein
LQKKKTCQIEACIAPKLQFHEFFCARCARAPLFTKITKETQNNRHIPACDVQKLTVMLIAVSF